MMINHDLTQRERLADAAGLLLTLALLGFFVAWSLGMLPPELTP